MIAIPQPPPHFLLGNLKDIDTHALVDSLVNLAQNFDGLYKIKLPGREVVIVYAQELVNELCDEQRFDKKVSRPLEILRGVIGDGLFTAETQEENWGKAHRLLMPAFGLPAVRGMFPEMLDIAEQLMLKMERYGEKYAVNVSEEMTRLTLDTIALCAFDYRFNSFYTENMHPFVNKMVETLVETGKIATRIPAHQKMLFRTNKKYAEDIAYLNKIADDVIAERKAHPTAKKDLLATMLDSVDTVSGEKLSDENIRYQLITFLIAGHETTSGLLSFTLYLLLRNPTVLEKLRHEIDTVLGNETPRVEHLVQLKYLEKVLKESLRLYPTAPAFAVKPYENTVFGGKYAVDKGQAILVLSWMLHRDKKVWGDDVEAFKPERFDADNWATLPPNSWKPFGNGQRACIGMSFAMQEAVLVIAMLLQRFDVEDNDPTYSLQIKETLTVKPEGFMVKVKKRTVVMGKGAPQRTITPKLLPTLSQETMTPILILYGSNSGSSENFARRLASTIQQIGFAVTVGELDNYVNKLPTTGATIVVTASYEGQPTNNAKQFVHWLENAQENALSGVKYAVLGCGHADWIKTYQAIPRKINALMQELGGECLLERGEADAANDFFGDFDTWQEALLKVLIHNFDKKISVSPNQALLKVDITDSRITHLQQTELQNCTIIENRELVNMEHLKARSKRHFEIALPEGMTYQSGDYVAILPRNPQNNVQRALKRFNLQADTQIIIQKNKDVLFHLPMDYPIGIADIFTNYVELAQPITRKHLVLLANACPCPPEKQALLQLAEAENYQKQVLSKRLSVLDLLEKYRSIDLSLATFLELLPPLKSRLYSISSTPLWDEKKLTLTVSIVKAPSWSGEGDYEGVASNYLANLAAGSILKMVTRPAATAFHLPENDNTPIIMVCAGTGLAPFRGFIQERAIKKANGKEVGESLLFFGCDHPDIDYLYQAELAEWVHQGVLKIHTAYSSLPEGDIAFVQHRLWKERAEVWALLEKNAKIYVCGDGKYMAPAVRDTFINIFKIATQASVEEAENWINSIQKDGVRYVTDVFI